MGGDPSKDVGILNVALGLERKAGTGYRQTPVEPQDAAGVVDPS